jgi:hypothetical protein
VLFHNVHAVLHARDHPHAPPVAVVCALNALICLLRIVATSPARRADGVRGDALSEVVIEAMGRVIAHLETCASCAQAILRDTFATEHRADAAAAADAEAAAMNGVSAGMAADLVVTLALPDAVRGRLLRAIRACVDAARAAEAAEAAEAAVQTEGLWLHEAAPQHGTAPSAADSVGGAIMASPGTGSGEMGREAVVGSADPIHAAAVAATAAATAGLSTLGRGAWAACLAQVPREASELMHSLCGCVEAGGGRNATPGTSGDRLGVSAELRLAAAALLAQFAARHGDGLDALLWEEIARAGAAECAPRCDERHATLLEGKDARTPTAPRGAASASPPSSDASSPNAVFDTLDDGTCMWTPTALGPTLGSATAATLAKLSLAIDDFGARAPACTPVP